MTRDINRDPNIVITGRSFTNGYVPGKVHNLYLADGADEPPIIEGEPTIPGIHYAESRQDFRRSPIWCTTIQNAILEQGGVTAGEIEAALQLSTGNPHTTLMHVSAEMPRGLALPHWRVGYDDHESDIPVTNELPPVAQPHGLGRALISRFLPR